MGHLDSTSLAPPPPQKKKNTENAMAFSLYCLVPEKIYQNFRSKVQS